MRVYTEYMGIKIPSNTTKFTRNTVTMLNKISLAILAASTTILSGFAAIPAYAGGVDGKVPEAKAGELAIQSSNYDFNAIYGGQSLHKDVEEYNSGKLSQHDYLELYKSNLLETHSSSDFHKNENASASNVESALVMPAIPGAHIGLVDLSGSKSTRHNEINVSGSENTKVYSESNIDQKSGMEKAFENYSSQKVDANGFNYGEGSFNATQFGFHGFQ